MLRAAWHGRRYNLQPADNGLLHPPGALRLAEVVPLLCAPQQEGPGQCLDRRRERQMAVDSGRAHSQGQGRGPGTKGPRGRLGSGHAALVPVQVQLRQFEAHVELGVNGRHGKTRGKRRQKDQQMQVYWVKWCKRS